MSITRLTLLTNPDKCNLHCPLCFLNQRGKKFGLGEMPFEIAEAAIQKYAATLKEVIPSTMGEPLLYSHFTELLELCKSLRIPLNITTNGTFPIGQDEFLERLLLASSDIKISCMGFSEETFAEMMPGFSFENWKFNLCKILKLQKKLLAFHKKTATISLQVTLHKKNVHEAQRILQFAEQSGISRIKWNPAVFLESAATLREKYGLNSDGILNLQKKLFSDKVRCEGSLFHVDFKEVVSDENGTCSRFANELWILPDGSVEHCPNPERRFGNPKNPDAACSHCPMRA